MLVRLRIENLVLIREAELELGPGITALTGETGAGKTIFANAVGLLLGAKGDARAVGSDGTEAYVEAEFEVAPELLDDDALEPLAALRPADERSLVLARRVFADGRTRAYAWGRSIAREDLAAAGERLVAMSGQFEQRRLARPSYQLDVLDAFCGQVQLAARAEARAVWRALGEARRRYRRLVDDAETEQARIAELRALVAALEGLEPSSEEALRAERERLRGVTDTAEGVAASLAALAPEDGPGADGLVAAAERAIAPAAGGEPRLAAASAELTEIALRLREVGSTLHGVLIGLEADPARQEEVEEGLERIATAKRRFRCASYEELFERRDAAAEELAAYDGDADPVETARAELERAESAMEGVARRLHEARQAARSGFSAAVAAELADVGMSDGEFEAELGHRELGPTGWDEVVFRIRANTGLPFAPVAETASGGELSRVALAIAAVGGGETMVFDEIDAGIGGVTAHKVSDVLVRLAGRSQVIVITHLPQIASRADRHFSVAKIPGDPTHTRIELLDDASRQQELERMLGGDEFLATVGRA